MKKLLVILFLLLAVGAAGLWWLRGSLAVELRNEQEGPVTAITVTYRGGHYEKARLGSGESVRFTPSASGGSGLQLRYTDAAGATHESKLDIYFEPEYRGEIIIHLKPGGGVAVSDRMNLH